MPKRSHRRYDASDIARANVIGEFGGRIISLQSNAASLRFRFLDFQLFDKPARAYKSQQ